ncbi:hypothetical protein HAX54_024905 [Datura stramonium]|uniref:Oberon coiled-coil region domain-containing protein n=1 Tax=Datura stramonium TaxID=4076 RepID=A0ABS8S7F4_DATST|nr:hypothetical protein [Datura stramonium]
MGELEWATSVKNGANSAETLFRYHACSRTSELFGWVKMCSNTVPQVGMRKLFLESSTSSGEFSREVRMPKANLMWILQEVKTMTTVPGPYLLKAFAKIADVVQEAIRKMEAVAEEKMRMVKKARLSLEACDQELKDKAREVTALKMERQKKKQQIEELESIVRLKQAEADMFDQKGQ